MRRDATDTLWQRYRLPFLHSTLAVEGENPCKIRFYTCKMPKEYRFLSKWEKHSLGSAAALRRAVTPSQ